MSNAVLPDFPGLAWSVYKTPVWNTKIQESVNGKELRTALMAYPLWKFKLNYQVLRAAQAYQELQQLIGFFNARRGSFDSFLYTDPDDNSVTDYQIGTADGVKTQFQLLREFGGFIEPIQNVNGTPIIKVNGVVKATPADYSISTTGLVVFTSAPVSGPITWTGNFYYRVRFEQDMAEFEQFLKDLWRLKSISLRSIKL